MNLLVLIHIPIIRELRVQRVRFKICVSQYPKGTALSPGSQSEHQGLSPRLAATEHLHFQLSTVFELPLQERERESMTAMCHFPRLGIGCLHQYIVFFPEQISPRFRVIIIIILRGAFCICTKAVFVRRRLFIPD